MIGSRESLVQALDDGGALDALWQRCASKVERRGGASGSVALIGDAERRGVGRLLGRRLGSTVGAVRLTELDEAMRRSALDAGLLDVLPAIVGRELRNLPAEHRAQRAEADDLWERAGSHHALVAHPGLRDWLASLRRTGSLRRVAAVPAEAAMRLTQALDVLAMLPRPRGDELLLAELAQRVLRDPHALDPGQPVGTLVTRALAHLEGEVLRGAGERRWLWGRHGVVCDRLSSSVLVLNLRATSPRPLSDLLTPGLHSGIPTTLTLQQVQSWCRSASWGPARVLACENPSVMERIAGTHGPNASALVCVSGQMSIAARQLLRALLDGGVQVAYHGDFDWGGLEIANQVMALGARPWRYRTADYLAAVSEHGGAELQGRRVPSPWDPELAIVMERAGRVVFEEAVLDQLCGDAGGISAD